MPEIFISSQLKECYSLSCKITAYITGSALRPITSHILKCILTDNASLSKNSTLFRDLGIQFFENIWSHLIMQTVTTFKALHLLAGGRQSVIFFEELSLARY